MRDPSGAVKLPGDGRMTSLGNFLTQVEGMKQRQVYLERE